ncbi:tRNA (adenosine(37)-N6)-threonylcarbamoyltransferase complex ATPase subunit type 1 TsaE [Yoonia sp. 208BN28-4]|uniref:tRNA (adenosine(37)-N6)-threonylcarbamoyltransferase complex ATPase subunit type 1 TsaE n=1 Tax=Yoonia sp. 208BN28-4 TaxID=3126505 RepID=UPI00309590A9
MAPDALSINTTTEQDTAALAAAFAARLSVGDTLLLEGDIGAGKSAFARALIQSRLGRAEDVPSPTFTIVQTYEAPDGDIWHCDLYRLTHPDEAFELGLTDAFDTAICLIEWPDRLGSDLPDAALTLQFAAHDTHHTITAHPNDKWRARIGDLFG